MQDRQGYNYHNRYQMLPCSVINAYLSIQSFVNCVTKDIGMSAIDSLGE